ncbi:MAG: PAS domain-containing sensor histidine kinase [Dehalococcoidia bacterium]|nr:PAS domain-containing sensor histidine kinase [Dehalococcoidia bacterium]
MVGDLLADQSDTQARMTASDLGLAFSFDSSQILDGLTDGLRIIDRDYTVCFINKAFARLSGVNPESAIGKKCFDIYPSSFCHGPGCRLKKIASNTGCIQEEIERQKPDGTVATCIVSAFPLFAPSGTFCAIVESFCDIMKERQLEREIEQSQVAEDKLKELLEQEVDLRRKLEATLSERAEFIRIIAHELRTPLTAMLAASDILCDGITSEPMQKLAKQVNKGALDLSTRINELFDLAKGEIGMLKLRCQEVFPNRILAGTLAYFAAEAKQAGIKLIPDWPDDLPSAWGDHRRVTEILNNLIGNAIKYTGENGQITVRARSKDNHILFSVEDTGCGIPPEKQSQIFQAHRRLNAQGEKRDGMGLGLALSKMLVELHGGQIWAESEGKGSIFSFTLPLLSNQKDVPLW